MRICQSEFLKKDAKIVIMLTGNDEQNTYRWNQVLTEGKDVIRNIYEEIFAIETNYDVFYVFMTYDTFKDEWPSKDLSNYLVIDTNSMTIEDVKEMRKLIYG